MKKICRTIKLKKFKSMVDLDRIDGYEYVVCFDDNTYKWCLSKSELRQCLENDHIKSIRYIFDMNDGIIISRDILIDTDEI